MNKKKLSLSDYARELKVLEKKLSANEMQFKKIADEKKSLLSQLEAAKADIYKILISNKLQGRTILVEGVCFCQNGVGTAGLELVVVDQVEGEIFLKESKQT